jgi:hypothetical protein
MSPSPVPVSKHVVKSLQLVPGLTLVMRLDWAIHYLFRILPKLSPKIITSFCPRKADKTLLRFADGASINVHQ